jgi:hypothetical protein
MTPELVILEDRFQYGRDPESRANQERRDYPSLGFYALAYAPAPQGRRSEHPAEPRSVPGRRQNADIQPDWSQRIDARRWASTGEQCPEQKGWAVSKDELKREYLEACSAARGGRAREPYDEAQAAGLNRLDFQRAAKLRRHGANQPHPEPGLALQVLHIGTNPIVLDG